ncbi:MAG: cobyric acid synthase [Clostridia bacterium]|nr:cobyric acid synthase [Clostridia bacterium]
MRGKSIMLQGTGSSVGKSLLAAALCRIFRQDGLRVAPFKAQNMALNSFATKEGLEMGRAQVVQAQAAGVEPSVEMNPILLKPTSDKKSQVIALGKPLGNMSAVEYHHYKPNLRRLVKDTYDRLEAKYDAVVIEGAGSPAEINLREGDLVNMWMAGAADAPVLLAGDIDRGGVFAALYGTVMLLQPEERSRIKGLIINKFRGDVRILEPGLRMIEDKLGIPVVGVVPWTDADIEDEDSVSQRFNAVSGSGEIAVSVVRLKHISNFTDFQALSLHPGVTLKYAQRPRDLEGADIIILPGTKNTIDDLIDLKNRDMLAPIVRHARAGGLLLGVCGGYQMLGQLLRDPQGVESAAREVAGLGLLDMEVTFAPDKRTVQAEGALCGGPEWLKALAGESIEGYEIHSGVNTFGEGARFWMDLGAPGIDGACNAAGNVLGTYLHGLFDDGRLADALVKRARRLKGLPEQALTAEQAAVNMRAYREQQFDLLAKVVRESLDMEKVYGILRGEM